MITRHNFKKIDHHWVAALNGTIMSIESHGGVFRLYVYGALAELPMPEDSLTDPTDREWITFLKLANDLEQVKRLAQEKQ